MARNSDAATNTRTDSTPQDRRPEPTTMSNAHAVCLPVRLPIWIPGATRGSNQTATIIRQCAPEELQWLAAVRSTRHGNIARHTENKSIAQIALVMILQKMSRFGRAHKRESRPQEQPGDVHLAAQMLAQMQQHSTSYSLRPKRSPRHLRNCDPTLLAQATVG